MKIRNLFQALSCLLLLPFGINAQEDTAHHRAVYQQIKQQEKTLLKTTATYKDTPLVFALTGWIKEGQIKKIVARSSEDGAGVEEYYLEDEKPLFVYSTYFRNHLSKSPQKIENRLYFRDGHIFKWLTNDSTTGILHGEDYAAETERLTKNCTAFIKALKATNKKQAGKTQVTEGIFLGIEQGDYSHWQLRTSTGKELSLFVLQPDSSLDKALENSQAFKGRKCKVTWKQSIEDIPEAGGKIEVEQILSVEWLSPK
ncbi:hypothetical protein [Prosthecobacter dejongeii]|uniref:DUF4412 domain-containing protein n=1 Tax=Prosthecobacter dejongeii TaxID=48465 RepID=A0A7W7YMN2_9BACT|nr:hypothetical protein [Prosthecobacter dejongeii]MBB5039011.1 hypothetical protein [Prosthecobacter dejongeii]